MGNSIVPFLLLFAAVFVLSMIASIRFRETLKKPIVQRSLQVLMAIFFAGMAIHQVQSQRTSTLLASFLAANAALMFVLAFAVEYRDPPEKPRTRFRAGHLLAMATLLAVQLGVHQAIRRSLPPKAPTAPALPAFPAAGPGGLSPRPNLTPIPRPQPLSPPGRAP